MCEWSRKEEEAISITVLSIRLNRCCSHILTWTAEITICLNDPLLSLMSHIGRKKTSRFCFHITKAMHRMLTGIIYYMIAETTQLLQSMAKRMIRLLQKRHVPFVPIKSSCLLHQIRHILFSCQRCCSVNDVVWMWSIIAMRCGVRSSGPIHGMKPNRWLSTTCAICWGDLSDFRCNNCQRKWLSDPEKQSPQTCDNIALWKQRHHMKGIISNIIQQWITDVGVIIVFHVSISVDQNVRYYPCCSEA